MKTYRDYYFLKAKQENYPARSIYKLQEINKRFQIIKSGARVLDLGASPGSWSLGASEMTGPSGSVLAVDIQETTTNFPPNVTFMREDVFSRSKAFEAELKTRSPFHAIISDMAPFTTGHRSTDQARSAALSEEALAVAVSCLINGGSFVVKVFMGPDTQTLASSMRKYFSRVQAFKPKSSRSESMETFYIGIGFKALPPHDPGGEGS